MAKNAYLRREALAFYLHKEGMMPPGFWEARVATLSSTFNQPGTRFFREISKYSLPCEFVDFLYELTSHESEESEKARQNIKTMLDL